MYKTSFTRVHPTMCVLIKDSVDDIREDSESWTEPANDVHEHQALFLLHKGIDKDHSEEHSLTQHPEVCRHHEVGRHDVKTSAPDGVSRPGPRIEQYKMIPEIKQKCLLLI